MSKPPKEYVRERRERLRAKAGTNPELVPHGTRNGYENWGCRCDPCRHAAVQSVQQSRRNKRSSPPPKQKWGYDPQKGSYKIDE